MTINVLFLCTGNSARSILAEAILGRLGEGRLTAFSAGSQPAGKVNPGAIDLLIRKGYDVSGLRSKSWDEFSGEDAPAIDLVFTVCDSAAKESCPVWAGHPISVHWGIPDPAAAVGEKEITTAFEGTYEVLDKRLRALVSLPLDEMNAEEKKSALKAIASQQESQLHE